jgi:hypothetical protein
VDVPVAVGAHRYTGRRPRQLTLQNLTFSMPCPEAARLKEEYRVALMRWTIALFAPQVGREAGRMRLAALDARNEATSRLVTHQQGCAICCQDDEKPF